MPTWLMEWTLIGPKSEIVLEVHAFAEKTKQEILSEDQIQDILISGASPSRDGQELTMNGSATFVPRPALVERLIDAMRPPGSEEDATSLDSDETKQLSAAVKKFTETTSSSYLFRWRRWVCGTVQNITLFFFWSAVIQMHFWIRRINSERKCLFGRNDADAEDSCKSLKSYLMPFLQKNGNHESEASPNPRVEDRMEAFRKKHLHDHNAAQLQHAIKKSAYMKGIMKTDGDDELVEKIAGRMSIEEVEKLISDVNDGDISEASKKKIAHIIPDLDTDRNNADEYRNRATEALQKVRTILLNAERKSRLRCDNLLSRLAHEYRQGNVDEQSRLAMINVGIEEIDDQFDVESHATRWLVAALPALGFIGTIIGIGEGLGKADGPVEATGTSARVGAVQELTSSLAVAFDTTLVALVLGLMATAYMMYKERLRGTYISDLRSLLIEAKPVPSGRDTKVYAHETNAKPRGGSSGSRHSTIETER
ncbi:MotA/TolQ/ExbB proton channel family protein [Roseiconus lacunae]|uniref:MotA/TolQ/ExbB proton channel family protein n=1 Tax=Roseiconus lacunae TaxID=2605694 RepID=A0ABT7PPZ1_9BACT|nr:MotA/TolQ/ExbB proton channel family protein [Roseiconus lacunae]MDM4018211.1 MotA/TolQ/ExbB proton channel family protein [Roseiconus lacunae]